MKLKIIFLKRKHIYYILFLACLAILFIVFIFSKNSVKTFNVSSGDTVIKDYDLNNDGSNDILYIKTNKGKYFVQVNCKNKSYILEPSKALNTMGSYKEYWPLTVTLADVSRDKTSEIFIQSSQNDAPIQHMFIWDNNNFKDVLSNYNNMVGFIDSHNNETPKIISANYYNGEINFSNFILVRNKMKSYNSDYPDNFIGRDTIASFISYIQNPQLKNAETFNKLFYPNYVDNFSSLFDKLVQDNAYTFQDGNFIDTRYNNDGQILELKWTLNFKAISKTYNTKVKNSSLKITLKNSGDNNSPYNFKITDILYN